MSSLSNLTSLSRTMQAPQDLPPEQQLAYEQAKRLDPGLTIPKFLESQSAPASHGNTASPSPVTLGAGVAASTATHYKARFLSEYREIKYAIEHGNFQQISDARIAAFVEDAARVIYEGTHYLLRPPMPQTITPADAMVFLRERRLPFITPRDRMDPRLALIEDNARLSLVYLVESNQNLTFDANLANAEKVFIPVAERFNKILISDSTTSIRPAYFSVGRGNRAPARPAPKSGFWQAFEEFVGRLGRRR